MANENMYDHLPALEAVVQAWTKPGRAPSYHARMQTEVRHISPMLWFAVRRAVVENRVGPFTPRHGEDTLEHRELLELDATEALLRSWRGCTSGGESLSHRANGIRRAVRAAMPLLGRALDRLANEATMRKLKESERAQWANWSAPLDIGPVGRELERREALAPPAKPESFAKMWAKNLWWWIPVTMAAGALGGMISRGF